MCSEDESDDDSDDDSDDEKAKKKKKKKRRYAEISVEDLQKHGFVSAEKVKIQVDPDFVVVAPPKGSVGEVPSEEEIRQKVCFFLFVFFALLSSLFFLSKSLRKWHREKKMRGKKLKKNERMKQV